MSEKFAHPDRIRYDGQCLTVDNKDLFLFSAAFHYFRCPKALWRDRFRRIQDAGCNAVETYVAWNWHERERPQDLQDFSKISRMDELDEWLTMAEEEFGLYTIARPGPYICAEWDVGGFPRWLPEEKPAGAGSKPWFRSDDPLFLSWSRHWYEAVCPILAGHQITKKSPGQAGLVLFQLENEYHFEATPDEMKHRAVSALAERAVSLGIEVPLFTCWTRVVRGSQDPWVSQVFDTCNFYPRWSMGGVETEIAQLRKDQPQAPVMITECQGGWFSNVGGTLSEDQEGLSSTQIHHLLLTAIERGVTGINTYMFFGGTNFGDWAARDITTTYDYYAPLRECGGVGEKYLRVQAIGLMLKEYGPRLARSRWVDCEVSTGHADVSCVMRKGSSRDVFVFLRNRSDQERQGMAVVRPGDGLGPNLRFGYELLAREARILYLPAGKKKAFEGHWIPDRIQASKEILSVPSSERISEAVCRDDPGGVGWQPVALGQSLGSRGVHDNGFVLYCCRFSLSDDEVANFRALEARLISPDTCAIQINKAVVAGKLLSSLLTEFDVSGALQTGENDLEILIENRGRPNGGEGMESLKGLQNVAFKSCLSLPLTQWRLKRVDSTGAIPEVAPDCPDGPWPEIHLSMGSRGQEKMGEPGAVGIFRTAIEVSEEDIQRGLTTLCFEGIDDHGWIYVNGKKIGEAHDWKKSFSFDASAAMLPGRNVIAVIVKNDQGSGGLTGGARVEAATSHAVQTNGWELSSILCGVHDQWWDPDLEESSWQEVELDVSSQASGLGSESPGLFPATRLATWYRLRFKIPESSGIWVPWKVRIHATGNGFMYLNGQPLGRYWEKGPQKEFYLPECWLNVGDAGSNVLALCLRPTRHGAGVHAAELLPYAEFSERR